MLAALWLTILRTGDEPRVELAQPLPPAVSPELRQLRVTLDQVPVPLVSLAPGGGVRALNRAARTMFGVDDLVRAPAAALLEAIGRAAGGERAVVRLGEAGGRSMAVSAASSFGPAGEALLAVLTDVQAEIQAAEAGALRDLLAVLGHEIMNALTPVTSLAESAHALLEGAPDAAQAREALEIIMRRARGLERFVQGYRALARVPAPVLRPASVGLLLREAGALFRARWGAMGVALAIAAPVPDIIAPLDADLVGQALLNLLANAAEAALAGHRAPHVRLSAYAAAAGVAFEVGDSGAGIAAADAAAIFQPFFTRKPQGSGIGLSLVRQIAQSHGGAVWLAPRPGGGGADDGACFVMQV